MKTQIWYRITSVSLIAEEVEVSRHSAQNVWLLNPPLFDDQKPSERMHKRDSHHEKFFPDAESAADYIKHSALKRKEAAEEQLKEANDALRLLKNRKLPIRKLRKDITLPASRRGQIGV